MRPTQSLVPLVWVRVARVAVALVWVYEGLVAKLLGTRPDEAAILASVPIIGGPGLGVAIGVWELLLALAVLSTQLPVLVAWAQTATLVVFNVGGLLAAPEQIPDATQLLITNTSFVALVWGVALGTNHVQRALK